MRGALLVLGLLLALGGCTPDAHPATGIDNARPATSVGANNIDATSRPSDLSTCACAGWPVRLALAFDQSASSRSTITEHPGVDVLDGVIACAERAGGQIFLATIRTRRPGEDFEQLFIPPRPVPPVPPAQTDNPLADFERHVEYNQARAAFSQALAAWEHQTKREIEEFRRAAREQLAQPPTAPETAFVETVERLFLTLDEPTNDAWLSQAKRILVLVTDADDTVASEPIKIPTDPPTILLVNGAGMLNDAAHLVPLRFTSLKSALRFITGGRHA